MLSFIHYERNAYDYKCVKYIIYIDGLKVTHTFTLEN